MKCTPFKERFSRVILFFSDCVHICLRTAYELNHVICHLHKDIAIKSTFLDIVLFCRDLCPLLLWHIELFCRNALLIYFHTICSCFTAHI